MNKEFLNESLECEEIVSGQEVADLMGMGDIYRQGKKMEKMDEELKLEAQHKFKNLIERMRKVDESNVKEIID